MKPGDDNEFWDILVFVVVILALATVFAFAGQKFDEIRAQWDVIPQEAQP